PMAAWEPPRPLRTIVLAGTPPNLGGEFSRPLKRVCHQDSTFCTDRSSSVLAANSTAQVNNVTTEAGAGHHFGHQPFQTDCFIGKHWLAKSDPIFKADHRSVL